MHRCYYHKGKHHFWSQILAGMIAIFLLPSTQGIETANSFGSNYQNQQVQSYPALRYLVKKLDQVRQTQVQLKGVNTETAQVAKIVPHFIDQQGNPAAPIRGSPCFM